MKKLILITLTLTGLFSTTQAQEKSKKSIEAYMAIGLSITNNFDTTFNATSYSSLEGGIMKNNFSIGLVLGRSNLSGFNHDIIQNYWYELKSALSLPIGNFSGYILFGIGNYFATDRLFIEYGAGFSYNFNKLGIFVQSSNWEGTWYVTPGLSYTF